VYGGDLADPKKIIRALDGLRSLKSFPSADAVNRTTGPQLPNYVSHSFGSLDQPWEILSKVVYRDGRILVGTAGKELDNQRAEIVRFIIPAKPGRSLSLFPALITPLPLANSVLCSPLVPIASNSGYEHGRSSPSVDPVHQGNQRFRTPDGNETRRQLHDAEHVAPR